MSEIIEPESADCLTAFVKKKSKAIKILWYIKHRPIQWKADYQMALS